MGVAPDLVGRACPGDPIRVIEALNHLISNALKFTARGGAVTLSADLGRGSADCWRPLLAPPAKGSGGDSWAASEPSLGGGLCPAPSDDWFVGTEWTTPDVGALKRGNPVSNSSDGTATASALWATPLETREASPMAPGRGSVEEAMKQARQWAP